MVDKGLLTVEMKHKFLNILGVVVLTIALAGFVYAEESKIDLNIVGATEIEKKADEGWLEASARVITKAMKIFNEKSANFDASGGQTERKYLCGVEKNEDDSYIVVAKKQ